MASTQNISVNVTDISFSASVWQAVGINFSFWNCNLEFLKILMEKGFLAHDINLKIAQSLIGSQIIMNEVLAKVEDSTLKHTNTLNNKAFIQAHNSTIHVNSLRIRNFEGLNLFHISAGLGQFRNLTLNNCSSAAPLIAGKSQSFLSFENSSFVSNSAPLISVEKNSSAIINNLMFDNNKVDNNSKNEVNNLVTAVGDSFLFLKNVNFSRNNVNPGTTVALLDHTIGIIQNTVFINNTVRNNFGHIHVHNGSLDMTGSKFSKNKGSAVSTNTTFSLIIVNCSFLLNSAKFGGALHLESRRERPRYVSNDACSLRQNIAHHNKKHVRPRAMTDCCFVHNSTFLENSAQKGGAISIENASIFLLETNFVNNTATNLAGAIFTHRSMINITRCIFEGNAAPDGGALFADCDSIFICLSNFTSNHAIKSRPGSGGSLFLHSKYFIGKGTALISKCVFNRNTAYGPGGAIFTELAPAIEDSTFTGNMARVGGGVSCNSATFINCHFESNAAENDGGALVFYTQVTISHTSFLCNVASSGGAVSGGPNTTLSCVSCFFHNNTVDIG